jgi:hypothetical protein
MWCEDAPSKKIWHGFEAIRWAFEIPWRDVSQKTSQQRAIPEELLVQIARNL